MYKRRFAMFLGIACILLLLGFTIVAALQKSSDNNDKAKSTAFPDAYNVGVWSWKSPDTYSLSEMQAQAAELQKNNIKTTYTDISSYADYIEITNPTEKQQKINALTAALKQFIGTFHGHGIAVRALAGNIAWGNTDSWHLPQSILEYVHTYNVGVASQEQLAGVQFDIEYYNDKTYKEDKNINNTTYLGLTNTLIAQQLQLNSDFPLGFTMPYWFDNQNSNAPTVTFEGVAKTPMQHVVDQLNILPNGYITVMAYRNTAKGVDGVIKHAQQEVDYASNKAHTKVYVGLETTAVKPSKITFYNKSKSDLIDVAGQTNQAFNAKPAFKGFTINDSDGLLQL